MGHSIFAQYQKRFDKVGSNFCPKLYNTLKTLPKTFKIIQTGMIFAKSGHTGCHKHRFWATKVDRSFVIFSTSGISNFIDEMSRRWITFLVISVNLIWKMNSVTRFVETLSHGQNFRSLCKILKVYLVFGYILSLLWQFSYAFG